MAAPTLPADRFVSLHAVATAAETWCGRATGMAVRSRGRRLLAAWPALDLPRFADFDFVPGWEADARAVGVS